MGDGLLHALGELLAPVVLLRDDGFIRVLARLAGSDVGGVRQGVTE